MKFEFYNNVLKSDKADDGTVIEKIDENKYRLCIANGDYNVRIYGGDLEDDGDVNLFTHLNGVKMPPIWVNDRSICKKDYLTKVTDGVLNIEFYGKYVCVQGIEISPQIDDIPKIINTKVETGENGSKVTLVITCNLSEKNGEKTVVSENTNEKTVSNSAENVEYHIYKKHEGSGKDEEIITVLGNIYEDTDVEPCHTYTYYAKKIDDLRFEGKPSEKVQITVKDNDIDIPSVKNLVVASLEESTVTLKWEGDEKAFAYEIYKKPIWGCFKKIGKINKKSVAGLVDTDDVLHTEVSCTFTDTDVYTDREYTYGVCALGYGGKSELRTVVSEKKAPLRKRQLEMLDRGLIGVYTHEGIFLSWRLCGYEYNKGASFNLYADGKKINEEPITGATNFLHKEGTIQTEYEVKMILNGAEEEKGYKTKPWSHNYMDIPIDKPEAYTTPDGHTYQYTANDASVADLDGDGEYEIILKWDCNGKDNSHKGYSGIVYLDAYKLDGTKLWRINLGPNIRCGAHYTQFMVYDFDGDGFAEVIMKTADGTVDNAGNAVGDITKDYRNSDGFILEGPEYLTLFDGRTGTVLDTVLYDPARGNVSDYGDSWGNRVDRFLACVAYLDGVHPSAVMCRGYYDHGRPTNLVAYDVKDKKLVKRWKFLANKEQNIEYTNQGFHNLAVADVDGDGCDEIVYGACVIDHDGTGLYSTGLEHGDAMHLGRFTPDSEGFDYYGIHEHAGCPYGIEARNAGTGEITFGVFTGIDTGRGLTAKIDPRYTGNQMWAFYGAGLYNYADGSKISDESPKAINFAIWWDGDLLRELLDHDWYGYETCVGIPKIYKWVYEGEGLDIIITTDNCLSNNGTKGNPCIQASIFGDWREEIVVRGKDSTFLRIYTTTDITEHRFYTFMHDYVYRLGIAWQNTAYNQPPHTSFYIGPDMNGIPDAEGKFIKPGMWQQNGE